MFRCALVKMEFHQNIQLAQKGVGVELKDSYFKQAILNLKEAEHRFKKTEQLSLI